MTKRADDLVEFLESIPLPITRLDRESVYEAIYRSQGQPEADDQPSDLLRLIPGGRA